MFPIPPKDNTVLSLFPPHSSSHHRRFQSEHHQSMNTMIKLLNVIYSITYIFYCRAYSAPPRRTQWWSCRRKAGSGSTPPTNATTTTPLTGIRMLLVIVLMALKETNHWHKIVTSSDIAKTNILAPKNLPQDLRYVRNCLNFYNFC